MLISHFFQIADIHKAYLCSNLKHFVAVALNDVLPVYIVCFCILGPKLKRVMTNGDREGRIFLSHFNGVSLAGP